MTATDPLQHAIDWQKRLAAANAGAAGIEDVRAIGERFMAERAGPLAGDVVVETVDAGGVPAEWVRVDGASGGPVTVFLHGGGLMLGAASEHRAWMARIARETRGCTLGVDYRLAPEHPYPAALDDACRAYRWLLDQGQDPADVAILGESAGGGLVLAALVELRDGGQPMPAAAILTSPLVDFTLGAATLDTSAETDQFVGREVLTMMMDAVLQGQDAHAASPLFRDLTGMPPMLVQVGRDEALYDDSDRLVKVARAAGVEATFEPWEDMIHLWHGFSDLPQAAAATARIAEFILGHVGVSRPAVAS
jgi:monoterpene epsilon-lactone hydrolase